MRPRALPAHVLRRRRAALAVGAAALAMLAVVLLGVLADAVAAARAGAAVPATERTLPAVLPSPGRAVLPVAS